MNKRTYQSGHWIGIDGDVIDVSGIAATNDFEQEIKAVQIIDNAMNNIFAAGDKHDRTNTSTSKK